ncbi:hypothetical protein LZ023_03445 [Pseudomonas silvicola]|nr:hypothetical protein LZ023_03445 [Pseudomonas silvicola]
MPLVLNLACHSGAILAYVLLWTYSFSLYRHWGGVITRGIDIGMASQLIFYVLVAINLVVAVLPSRRVKYALAVLAGALILAYLLPDYPLRAPLFAVLATGTTSLAVWCSGFKSLPRQ